MSTTTRQATRRTRCPAAARRRQLAPRKPDPDKNPIYLAHLEHQAENFRAEAMHEKGLSPE